MKNIKRIAIIGNAGSGKSTLTQQLHEIFNLPVYHMDKYFWKPYWTYPDPEEYKIIHDKICDQDAWIIDAMNLRLLEYRIARADIIIFLDRPRYICFWRIFKRLVKYYGKQTPSAAEKCREEIGFRFVKFLKWVWDFKKNYPPKIMELLNKSNKKFYIFKSQKEVDQFLNKLTENIL